MALRDLAVTDLSTAVKLPTLDRQKIKRIIKCLFRMKKARDYRINLLRNRPLHYLILGAVAKGGGIRKIVIGLYGGCLRDELYKIVQGGLDASRFTACCG
jgi:hypothetical protein